MKVLLSFICIVITATLLAAVDLKMMDTVTLTGGGEDDFIKQAFSFAVTEDGLYLVVDQKEADIKVFDLKGRFVKRVGRKGYGPTEFARPLASDYFGRQFIVLDLDRRQFTLLSRAEDCFLKENKVFRSIFMGNDVAMMKDEKALLAGYQPDSDGKEWALFTYNFKTKQFDFLVTKAKLYGFESDSDYKRNEDDINPIGISGFCDWWGEYAYLVWVGDLKVLQIDMKTKQIIRAFGQKTDFYRKPVATDKLKKAYKEANLNEMGAIKNNLSAVMGIFTNRNYLLLSYTKPIAEGERVQSRMLQIYTLEGEFLKEIQITHNNGGALYLSKDRDEDILYMLQLVYGGADETEENYVITRFQLVK